MKSSLIKKTGLAFTNVKNSWRRRDIFLSTKGRLYPVSEINAALHFQNGCWDQICKKLSVFEHRCPRSFGKMRRVRRNVLGPRVKFRTCNKPEAAKVVGSAPQSIMFSHPKSFPPCPTHHFAVDISIFSLISH